jgi:hypothetical protein
MPHALTDLRHMPVHVGDHSVGSVTELILDPVEDTVLGFVVRAVTERSYFMPLALTHFREGGIWLSSPLHLVDDVDHYRRRGRSLAWPAADQLQVELAGGRIVQRERPDGSHGTVPLFPP